MIPSLGTGVKSFSIRDRHKGEILVPVAGLALDDLDGDGGRPRVRRAENREECVDALGKGGRRRRPLFAVRADKDDADALVDFTRDSVRHLDGLTDDVRQLKRFAKVRVHLVLGLKRVEERELAFVGCGVEIVLHLTVGHVVTIGKHDCVVVVVVHNYYLPCCGGLVVG